MKKKILLGLATVGVTLLLSSCGKVPQVEIDAANNAITEVKAAGAESYLPEEFAALQDSMRVTLENVEVQKSKLFKKFGPIKIQLANIVTLADTVKKNTEIKKEAVKQEVQTTLVEVTTLIEENKTLLTKAPKGKEGAAALEAIKNDITTIEGSLVEVNTMVEAGDYMSALYKVKASKEKSIEINTELTTAIEKVKGRK